MTIQQSQAIQSELADRISEGDGIGRGEGDQTAPTRIVEGGIPTEALIAQVVVPKYADHVPLYRQAQIYARQDIKLDRSTLADWVGRAAWHLRPLRDHILERLRRSERLFAERSSRDAS